MTPDKAPSPRRLAVGLAIANDLAREGLTLHLADLDSVHVVIAASTLAPFVDDAIEPAVVDVVVVDMGADASLWLGDLARLRREGTGPRAVALHDSLPASQFSAVLAAGATVLVDVASGIDAIVGAIVGTSDRSLRRWVRPRVGAMPLSARERQVLELLALGRSSSEIAAELGITVNTVAHHKARVFRKLSATNQAQAVAMALRSGQIAGVASAADPEDEAGVADGSKATVAVVGTPTLLTRSVERILAAWGCEVAPFDTGSPAMVAVLVEPAAGDWKRIVDAGVPAVVLRAREPDGETVLAMVTKGAHAIVPVECAPPYLVDVVMRVARGDTGLTRAQTRRLADALRGRSGVTTPDDLAVTPRERQILDLLDRGLSVKQAGHELGISPRTVENTRRVLYRKLGVRNRAEAIASAYARGVLGDPLDL